VIGSLQMPTVSVSGSIPKSGPVTIPDTPFPILDAAAMAAFVSFMAKTETFSWRVTGTASAKALGMTFNNLKLDKVITMKGLNGLNQIQVGQVIVTGGDARQGIIQQISFVINNPSNIGIVLGGDAQFLLAYNGITIGYTVLKDLVLVPGPNNVVSTAILNPTDQQSIAASKAVLSGFMQGKTTALTIVGTPQSVKYASLAPAFQSLSIPVNLPGQTQPLITGLKIMGIDLSKMTATVILVLNNPLDTAFTLTDMTSNVLYNGQPFASVAGNSLSSPFNVPARSSGVSSPTLTSTLQLSAAAIQASLSLISAGGVKVDVSATMAVNVGTYPTGLEYSQAGVTLTMDPSVNINIIPGLPGLPAGGLTSILQGITGVLGTGTGTGTSPSASGGAANPTSVDPAGALTSILQGITGGKVRK
jgi:hypothetical protein